MIIVYGIKNCDTVKKALKWLTEHNIEHKLHDYRVDGLDTQFLQQEKYTLEIYRIFRISRKSNVNQTSDYFARW